MQAETGFREAWRSPRSQSSSALSFNRLRARSFRHPRLHKRSPFFLCFSLHTTPRKGMVDDQFLQLYQLQDESNPDFVAEVVALYFEDSERLLEELTRTLSQDPVDFKVVDAYVHQLKGSCSSLGVLRVKNACIAFRTFYESSDLQGCWQALQQLKQEYIMLKGKLEELLDSNTAPPYGLDASWTSNGQIDQSFGVRSGETMTS